jgi:hypothetical protein
MNLEIVKPEVEKKKVEEVVPKFEVKASLQMQLLPII